MLRPTPLRRSRFDNEYDRTPACEANYLAELREFRTYLKQHTDLAELKGLNLLGIQFALCEASKYRLYSHPPFAKGSSCWARPLTLEASLQRVCLLGTSST